MQRIGRIMAVLVASVSLAACGGTAPVANPPAGSGGGSGGNGASAQATAVVQASPVAADATPVAPASGKAEQANPADVVVTLGSAGIDADAGFYRIYGTVQNKAQSPITGQIKVVYYDKDGKVIAMEGAEADGTPFFQPIQPGQTGYFFHLRDLKKIAGTVDHVEVALDYAMLEAKSPVAEFSDTQWSFTEDLAYSGTVRNTGNATCTIPSAAAILLKEGVPVGAETVPLDADPLEAGATAKFEGTALGMFLPEGVDDVAFVLDCGPLSFER